MKDEESLARQFEKKHIHSKRLPWKPAIVVPRFTFYREFFLYICRCIPLIKTELTINEHSVLISRSGALCSCFISRLSQEIRRDQIVGVTTSYGVPSAYDIFVIFLVSFIIPILFALVGAINWGVAILIACCFFCLGATLAFIFAPRWLVLSLFTGEQVSVGMMNLVTPVDEDLDFPRLRHILIQDFKDVENQEDEDEEEEEDYDDDNEETSLLHGANGGLVLQPKVVMT